MNWYIGQEVVCIKTHSMGLVIKDRVYTIQGIRSSHCACKKYLLDVGMPMDFSTFNGKMKCGTCVNVEKHISGRHWFSESLFAPLEYDKEAIEELLKQPVSHEH